MGAIVVQVDRFEQVCCDRCKVVVFLSDSV